MAPLLDPFRRAAPDLFRSAWDILTETTVFIGMLPDGEGEVYQESLRNWRQLLQTKSRDPETVKSVREEIVALRKAFRKNGYDVSLGSLDIVCEGFKNEIAIREGYQRIVILIGAQEILYETGTGNHLDLWEALEQRSRRLFRGGEREYHHLWYKWKGKILYLAGADSESKEDFHRFCHIVETKKLRLLSALKRLP